MHLCGSEWYRLVCCAVSENKRAELRDWAEMLRRKWDSAGPEARGFAAVTDVNTAGTTSHSDASRQRTFSHCRSHVHAHDVRS